MTYESKADLPETLRSTLPDEAQDIYIEAYNRAMTDDSTPTPGGELPKDAAAHAVAWQAIETEFENVDGRWYRKDEVPDTESESEEGGGILDRIRNLF